MPRGLLEEKYADARDKKLHRRESFLKSKERRKALKKSKGLKSQFHEAGTPAYANEINELLGHIGRYAMTAFGTQNLGPGKAKKRGFSEAQRAKSELQDEILQGNFGYEDEGASDDQVADSEMDAYEKEYWDEIDAENRQMDWDIDHLQRLTREKARRADLLSSRNRAYYTKSYPDLVGREMRERERREADYALREAGRDVVPEAFSKLASSDTDFADLPCHFRKLIAQGYEGVDNKFEARRLKQLQDVWAKLEGAKEDGDEALAA